MGFLKHLLGGIGRGGHHSSGHNRKHDSGNRNDYFEPKIYVRCITCGVKNDESTDFCQKCGSSLGKGKCKNCNEGVPIDAKFCPSCGNKNGG
jgi:ribosomal protein L40E